MSLTLEMFLAFAHILFGLVLPALYLVYSSRRGVFDQKIRCTVGAWQFLSWAIFFAGTGIYVTTNFVFGQGIGGLVALLIGVIPFVLLATFALSQARIQWNNRR
jgi:hypothetical protein